MSKCTTPSLLELPEAITLARDGACVSFAGPESLLDQLPPGNWIGGTTCYFMTAEGSLHSTRQLFATPLPSGIGMTFTHYRVEQLDRILSDAPENGFSLAVIPSGSRALQRFGQECRYWPDAFQKPLVGWISGVDLQGSSVAAPKVYLGTDASKYDDGAVVIHVSLPAERMAAIDTVSIFDKSPNGVIRFPNSGFEVLECTIDGQPARLADILAKHGDTRLPLIGDFSGAHLNSSIRSIDPTSGRVTLYAPVFADVEYHLAKPVPDYAARIGMELDRRADKNVIFSCNCILNYLYGQLEGKCTGSLQGPVTFGEIAYLLHNQTLALLVID